MELSSILRRDHTALLVIDKQAAYFDPRYVSKRGRNLPQNASQILQDIDSLVHAFRRQDMPVIWTRMIEDKELSPKVIASKMERDEDYTTISRPNDSSFDFAGTTRPLAGEHVINKKYYDAFAQTDLALYLRTHKIDALVIVGGYASRCVLSTCVGANGNDTHVVVPRGCVINQTEFDNETVAFYSMVDAILGYVTDIETVINFLGKPDSH